MRKSLLAIATELVCLVAVPMTDVSAVSNRCLKFAEADTGIRSMTENEFAAYQDSGLLTKMKILTKSSDEKDFKYIL